MDHFVYRHGELYAEDVRISEIAATVGTPFYCYSHATLARHYHVFREGLSALNPMICFAAKANGNRAVLAALAREGAGCDVVSEGEIRLARSVGIPAEKIVFSGVGKTRDEMRYALQEGIFQFNVESLPELELLNQVAGEMGKTAPIALRVNPDVDAQTHAKISTGGKETKFGIAWADAPSLFRQAQELPHIRMQGVSVHIGSQLTTLEPFAQAFRKVRLLVETLRGSGIDLRVIDLGGGLGIPYEAQADNAPPLPQAYGAMVSEIFAGMEAQFVFEPGRLLVGNAGILVSRVIYVKQHGRHRFVIVDAAMNDLLRPSLYGAHHDIVPVREDARPLIQADIVGPVCETGDIFASARLLPEVHAEELVAFRSAGAYGASMSSTYNARLLVPEVMVNGASYAVIRPRPGYDALIARDVLPEWLADASA